MRLGIGIITYKRPLHLQWCLDNIKKHTSGEYEVYVYDDAINRRGIAYGKNMCLFNLKHCDNIVLLDDDTSVIKDDWQDYFINSGYNHSLYMNDTYQPVYHGDHHTSYFMCSGVFMFLTKKVIETVGYFNSDYGLYGYEHAGYSHRINKAGLTPAKYLVLNDTNKYIYSLDFQGVGDTGLVHARSLPNEEADASAKENNKIYHIETSINKIYYGFKP